MPLNKTKGNMYAFITHTWNPIKGECPHNCSYCYVKKIHKRFGLAERPSIVSERFGYTLGRNKFIFVGSAFDCWAENVPDDWIRHIISFVAGNSPQNAFLFQTKNPARFLEWMPEIPNSVRFCVTLESSRNYPEYYGNSPAIVERVEAFAKITRPKMITIEPVLDFDTSYFVRLIQNCGNVHQVNIGADSGRNHLQEPPREKLEALLDILAPHTRIHLKSNLRRILPESRYYEDV